MNEPILTLRHMDDIVYIIFNMVHIIWSNIVPHTAHTVWNILAPIYSMIYILYQFIYKRPRLHMFYLWVYMGQIPTYILQTMKIVNL